MSLEVEEIEIEESFFVPKKILFNDLLDSKSWIRVSLGSNCNIEPKVGGTLSLFDNNVTGRFLKIDEFDLLEFEWRFNDFPENHNSVVSLKFYEVEENITRLVISHKNIPKYDKFGNGGIKTRCLVGWKDNFIDRIHPLLGYNKYSA